MASENPKKRKSKVPHVAAALLVSGAAAFVSIKKDQPDVQPIAQTQEGIHATLTSKIPEVNTATIPAAAKAPQRPSGDFADKNSEKKSDAGEPNWEEYVGNVLKAIAAKDSDHESYLQAHNTIWDELRNRNTAFTNALWAYAMQGNLDAAQYLSQWIQMQSDPGEEDAFAERVGLGTGVHSFLSAARKIKHSLQIVSDGEAMSAEIANRQNFGAMVSNPQETAIGSRYFAILSAANEFLTTSPDRWDELVRFVGDEQRLRDALLEGLEFFEANPKTRDEITNPVALRRYRDTFKSKLGLELESD